MEGIFGFLFQNVSQPGIVLVGVYFMLKGLRDAVDRLNAKIAQIEAEQHAVEINIHKLFASREDVNGVANIVRDHEARISRLEGKYRSDD